jgi:hypothetical protein
VLREILRRSAPYSVALPLVIRLHIAKSRSEASKEKCSTRLTHSLPDLQREGSVSQSQPDQAYLRQRNGRFEIRDLNSKKVRATRRQSKTVLPTSKKTFTLLETFFKTLRRRFRVGSITKQLKQKVAKVKMLVKESDLAIFD